MDYRTLGRTGVKIAPLALGTDNFANPLPADEATPILLRALDAGINLVDTSNSYAAGESERIIGRTVAQNGRRQEVILATKAHYPTGPGPNDRGNSRLHLMRACEESLRRLQTDYIDLYQLHRPVFDMPIDETLGALTDLVRQGKVRYIGSSTAPAWKVLEGVLISELKGYARFVSEQPPYNLLDRRIENELVPMCQSYGVGVLTWAPLAMGMLAGRYHDATQYPTDSRAHLRGGIYAERVTASAITAGQRFVQLARDHGRDPAQLALLWAKDQPGITACDAIVPPGSAVANFHNTSGWMKTKFA